MDVGAEGGLKGAQTPTKGRPTGGSIKGEFVVCRRKERRGGVPVWKQICWWPEATSRRGTRFSYRRRSSSYRQTNCSDGVNSCRFSWWPEIGAKALFVCSRD